MNGEIDYEKLAHVVMEAELSHHLLSARWRPRSAGGVIPVRDQRPENPGATDGVSSGPRAEDHAQQRRQGGGKQDGVNPSCLCLFLFRIGRCPPHWGAQSTSLSPIQMLRPPGSTLADTRRNNVGSEHPLAQRNCHRKITITRRLC